MKKVKNKYWYGSLILIYKITIIIIVTALILLSCSKDDNDLVKPPYDYEKIITDIDGNKYHTVKIGNQEWMIENLRVKHYRNGNAVPNVTSDSEWFNLSISAYCVYDNNEVNASTYGYLYNWHAVNDSQNIAPSGWHVPSDEEWKQLEMYLGMSQAEADAYGPRSTDVGGKMKETGINYWISPNTGANNESGFTGLPGGYRHDGDSYEYIIAIYCM